MRYRGNAVIERAMKGTVDRGIAKRYFQYSHNKHDRTKQRKRKPLRSNGKPKSLGKGLENPFSKGFSMMFRCCPPLRGGQHRCIMENPFGKGVFQTFP